MSKHGWYGVYWIGTKLNDFWKKVI
jgi:hypothetical protein